MDANQARRRTDPDPKGGSIATTPCSVRNQNDSTIYSGLKIDDTSLRLLRIEPGTSDPVRDSIVCTLEVVQWKDKPKFTALSYMWGTDEPRDIITLNGTPFKVRRNLFDALHFLCAHPFEVKRIWIDALCINQDDKPERNEQVHIMAEIYSRASNVMVWLGSKYSDMERRIPDLRAQAAKTISTISETSLTSSRCVKISPPSDDKVDHEELVKTISHDEYWDRVWIIQEIARARHNCLTVCFGSRQVWKWEDFIAWLNGHHIDGNKGPLRLDDLRHNRHTEARTLKRLLEDHKDAKATDSRDKVYALVGYAIDATDFPIDYRKSRFEVWRDTMVYMRNQNLFLDNQNIINMGRLIKYLLMGDISTPLGQALRPEAHDASVMSQQSSAEDKYAALFDISTGLLGMITMIGAPIKDIVARPSAVIGTRRLIQQAYEAQDLARAHKELDQLVQAFLDMHDHQIERLCYSRASVGEWKDQGWTLTNYRAAVIEAHADHVKHFPKSDVTSTEAVQSVIFGMRGYTWDKKYVCGERSMGVAPSFSRLGDLVCRIPGIRRALLIRATLNDTSYALYRMIGTVLTTEEISPSIAEPRPSNGRDDTVVRLDAETIFMLAE